MQLIKKYWIPTIAIVLLLAMFFLAYRPTLFNFFIADDFWRITWAYAAGENPKLLLEKFFGSWQGCFICNPPAEYDFVYRPLLQTVFYLGYKTWGANSVCFRLLNLITELLCGLMLGQVIISLNQKAIDHKFLTKIQVRTWGFLSAALFIFYPLHSEPVNWINDIMDPLEALFILFCLWCYIQWRSNSNKWLLTLSIISAILAFLTKEMAAALPPTIFIYELLLGKSTNETIKTTSIPLLFNRFYKSIIATLPYWLILVLYLCWRKIILGDFIAGYPDSMCYPTLQGWLHGLLAIFIPINTLVIGSHSYIFKLWHVALVVMISLTVFATLKTTKNNYKVLSFIVCWFALCIVPVYKVFPTLMSCGTGSRLAYLATAPLCAFLTYGLAMFSSGNRFSYLCRITALIALVLATQILFANNLAWAEAGLLTNNVLRQLKDYYKNVADDPFVFITGLPTNHKDIFAIGVLGQLTRKPIMDRDINNCARLDFGEQHISLGFLKQAVDTNKQQIHLLYWDSSTQKLMPVSIPPQNVIFTHKWQGDALKQIIRVFPLPSMPTPELHWLRDGTLELASPTRHSAMTAIELDLPKIPCWSTDYLILKAQFIHHKDFSIFGQSELHFTNAIAKDYSREFRAYDHCNSSVNPTQEWQEIIFPLRNIAAWNMGNTCFNMRITLPIESSIKISEISIPKTENLLPKVYLQQSSSDPPGLINLNSQDKLQRLQYDARSISGSKRAILEVIPCSNSFEYWRSKIDKMTFSKASSSRYGQFIIYRKEFPIKDSFYKARIKILDNKGNQIGFPSDTFFIYAGS